MYEQVDIVRNNTYFGYNHLAEETKYMSARQGVGRLRTWVRAGCNECDSEFGAQIACTDKRRMREMRGDRTSGWSGLTSVRSIGCGGKSKVEPQMRGRVSLVGRTVLYGWDGDVIEI